MLEAPLQDDFANVAELSFLPCGKFLKFSSEGKACSVYIPAEQQEPIRRAHEAWLRFNEVAAQIASGNRERLLKALQSHKRVAKAARTKASAKA